MLRHLITVVATFALASLARYAVAVELPERDWHYVELDDDHVEIYLEDQTREKCAIPKDTAGDLVVPERLGGRIVVSIGKNAFYSCSKLTSVSLPSGVTNIAANAFCSCSSLTNVVFPAGLRAIGDEAFRYCSSLRQLDFSCAQLSIGARAFEDIDGLKQLYFKGESLTIGEYSFFGCGGLRSAEFEARELRIGENAFSGGSDPYYYGYCDALKSLVVNCRTIVIGARAFASLSGLQSIQFNGNQLNIGTSSFSQCSALTNAVLRADASATIGESAFYNCTLLRDLELPEALTTVSKNTFTSCTSLESVCFSTNLTTVGYQAFDTCTNLSSVTFGGKETTIEDQAFYGCSSLLSLDFPVTLERVGSRAFEYCDALTNVTFAAAGSNDVRKIVQVETQAFNRCGNLVHLQLPTDMSEIGSSAFVLCKSLSELIMPTNLNSIADHAFEGCSALKSVELPETLRNIGRSAFYTCSSLRDFSIPTNRVVALGTKAFYNTQYWNDWPDGTLVQNNGYILGFKGNPTSVILPETCIAIPESMFENMTSLREVIIPSSVTSVGARAFAGSGVCDINLSGATTLGISLFEGCSSLTNVTLSSGLAAIPASSFRACTALTAIKIPSSVKTIGEYAFYGCSALITVSGGEGVRTVKDSAFENCLALQPFAFPDGTDYGTHVFRNVPWTEFVLFPAVGTMQDEYPQSYSAIRSVIFPSSVTSIVARAFVGCDALESVVLPSKIKSIGESAFSGCASLMSIAMGGALSSVGTNAFDGCTALSHVVLSGHQPASLLFPDRYGEIPSYSLASGVTVICSNMLAGCKGMKVFDIPEGITEIQSYAFSGCSSLDGALELPSGLTALGDKAFSRCSSLDSVAMPISLVSVGKSVFEGCTSVKQVTLSGYHPMSYLFPDSYNQVAEIQLVSDATSVCSNLVAGCSLITSFVIPVGVTSIGAYAFEGCTGLTGAFVVPETVTSIGVEAFSGCRGLTTVRYLGDMPSVGANIYKNTSGSLISAALEAHADSWASSGTLPSYWPVGDAYRRPTGWWVGVKWAVVKFDLGNNKTSYIKVLADGLHSVTENDLPDEEAPEGLTHDGFWYLSPIGGDPVEFPLLVTQSFKLYRHWESDEEEDDSSVYDFASSVTFYGYLFDGDSLCGSLKLAFSKGKRNRKSGEMEASVTATVELLGEGKISLKGVLDSNLNATLYPTKRGDSRVMQLAMTDSGSILGLEGDFDGYSIVSARDIFSSKTDSDKGLVSAMKDLVGTYAVAFASEGGPQVSDGCCWGLSIKVTAKGKVTIAGTLPDATKLSASAQMFWIDGRYVVPVIASAYKGKRGGIGFLLSFDDEDASVEMCSSWIRIGTQDTMSTVIPFAISRVASLEADASYYIQCDEVFDIPDVAIQSDILPSSIVSFSSKSTGWVLPKADRVKFVKDLGAWEVQSEFGNSVGLKLSYKAATGVFNGSFAVLGTTRSGGSYKKSATVNGVVVNGIGYGHAYMKGIGSVPFLIEIESP